MCLDGVDFKLVKTFFEVRRQLTLLDSVFEKIPIGMGADAAFDGQCADGGEHHFGKSAAIHLELRVVGVRALWITVFVNQCSDAKDAGDGHNDINGEGCLS